MNIPHGTNSVSHQPIIPVSFISLRNLISAHRSNLSATQSMQEQKHAVLNKDIVFRSCSVCLWTTRVMYSITAYYKPSVRATLENIGLRSWQYRPIAARSLQKQLYINIPQYGLNKQRLVYYVIYHMALIIMHQTCFEFAGFCKQKYMAFERFFGSSPYGKVLTK